MENKITILDGAMGTMLWEQGLKVGETGELVSITHPEWLEAIYRSYVDAGSQVIYANTFGANALKLRGSGHRVWEIVYHAVKIARDVASQKGARVALDVGPLGALLEPMGTLTFEKAYDLFAEMMQAGQDAGADLVVIETMTDLYEAKAALLAAKEHTNLPVWVTMSFDVTGRTFTGCTVQSMVATLQGLGADAIGVNCSLGPVQLKETVEKICAITTLPVILKPNAGLPDPVDGHYSLSPEAFAQQLREIACPGVAMVGGCCGTNPSYIRAVAEAFKDYQVRPAPGKRKSMVTSATQATVIDGVRVIGERINPTGKKVLQQALIKNDLDYLVEIGLKQVDAGADILDVNVGYPGVDEVTMLPRVVKKLQSTLAVPLQLDSSNPEALQAALRVYNGKPAVNSVNGSEESMQAILPIVKKYGAAVVALTLDENGIPENAEKRIEIASRIFSKAWSMGIAKQDIWVDCLTLTVSAQQTQAMETLRAVRHVREKLGLQTVLGVSNISFGLPERGLMTRTFLTAAMANGLTLPIINPNQLEMMDAVAAWRVLSGEDDGSRQYVDRFAQRSVPSAAPHISDETMTLQSAVIRGLGGEAAKIAKAMLKDMAPLEMVESHLIPALDRVGQDYEKGVAFLPQLMSAAQAAEQVFALIKAAIAQGSDVQVKKGCIVIATVHGDIHDIGKNIVRTVLENYGYDVIDLGRDVPPQKVVEEVAASGARLVGLSALMTTTLPAMQETVEKLKSMQNPPVVMVGGAVVTQEYASEIGADYYARDARCSAQIAREVLG